MTVNPIAASLQVTALEVGSGTTVALLGAMHPDDAI